MLATHPDDPWAQAMAMDEAVTRNIAPWYLAQVGGDSERLVTIRRALRGEPPIPLPDIADGVTLSHLRAAAMTDPDLFRALSSVLTMLRTADVLADPDVQAQVRSAFAAGNIAVAPPGPSRPELLADLEAAR